jgi:hypothetical protein
VVGRSLPGRLRPKRATSPYAKEPHPGGQGGAPGGALTRGGHRCSRRGVVWVGHDRVGKASTARRHEGSCFGAPRVRDHRSTLAERSPSPRSAKVAVAIAGYCRPLISSPKFLPVIGPLDDMIVVAPFPMGENSTRTHLVGGADDGDMSAQPGTLHSPGGQAQRQCGKNVGGRQEIFAETPDLPAAHGRL